MQNDAIDVEFQSSFRYAISSDVER